MALHVSPGIAGPLGAGLLKILGATWRIRTLGRERETELFERRTPPLYAFWHGKLLPLTFAYRGRGAVVLISRHRDGEIIARIVEGLGYATVRGSTTRGGARALLEMSKVVRWGLALAVTPDGPRGPAEEIQPGLLLIAQRSRVPVVALGVAAHPSTRFGSWDAFLVPHPWARCIVSVAPPFWVPRGVPAMELLDRFGRGVADFMKANDDHAHRELLRWTAGETDLVPFSAAVPDGLEAVPADPQDGSHGDPL